MGKHDIIYKIFKNIDVKHHRRNVKKTKIKFASESSSKIKLGSPWTFFVILLISAVIGKQRVSHGNEIMQYFKNYKYYDND